MIWAGGGNDLAFGLGRRGGLVFGSLFGVFFGFDFADGLDEFGIHAGVGIAKDVGIAESAEGGFEFSGSERNGLEHDLGEIDEVGGGLGIKVAAGDGVVEPDE